MVSEVDRGFDELYGDALLRVRRAAIARYGFEVGVEAAAEARAWAWAHRDDACQASNLGGLLFRVAQSHARPHNRWRSRQKPVALLPDLALPPRPDMTDLLTALGRLTTPQRVAVVLVHAHGESYEHVADVLGITTAAVTNHVHRGLKNLRAALGEDYES